MKKTTPTSSNTLYLSTSIVFSASMSLTILDSQVNGINGFIYKRISRSCLASCSLNTIHNSQDVIRTHAPIDK